MTIGQARVLFRVGAMWNFAVAFVMFAWPAETLTNLYGEGPWTRDAVAELLWSDFAAFVFLFGVGYFIVSRDPTRNHGIILLGIFGKGGLIVTLAVRLWLNQVTAMAFGPVVVDAIFAGLFTWFLVRYHTHDDM